MRVAQTLLNRELADTVWLFRSLYYPRECMFLSPFADGETKAQRGYSHYWHIASIAEWGLWTPPITLVCAV